MSRGIDTPRARFKLEEAEYFLGRLREQHRQLQGGSEKEFAFLLSAFLNADYTLTEILEREGKTALKKSAQNRGQAKRRYEAWKKKWVNDLVADDALVWELMEEQRWREVHEFGAKTELVTKPVPTRH